MTVHRAAALLAGRKPGHHRAVDPLERHYVTVTSVTAGAASDGRPLVTVAWLGSDVPASYLDSYTAPAVGDFVAVSWYQNELIIHGRIVGRP